MLTGLPKFITNKYFISAVILVLISIFANVLYTNHINTKWQNVLLEREAKIADLEKKHQEAKETISNLSGQLTAAKQETQKAEIKVKKLQKTVDDLIGQYDGSTTTTTTTYNTPAEEIQALKIEAAKMRSDIKVFIEEIKADRELIELKNKELALYAKKEELLTSDVKDLETMRELDKKTISDLKYKINEEVQAKKTWKVVAGTSGAALVVTIITILLL